MRKFIVLAVFAALTVAIAGCGGVSVDSEVLTDCVMDCAMQTPVVIVDANGDSTVIYPGSYSKWIWKDDGTVELKGEK